MRGSRGEFYLRHDFYFYDSGLQAAMGLQLFAVYDLLRRFIWRSEERGDREVRDMLDEGKIVTKVSQEHLADHLGCTRDHVYRLVAKLKKLGWVRAVSLERSMVNAYVLGEVVKDSRGGFHEVFFADGWLDGLLDAHLAEAARREAARRTARREHQAGTPYVPTYFDLSIEERVAVTKEYLNKCLGAVPGPDSVSPSDRIVSDPSNDQEVAGVKPPRIGEEENLETRKGDAPRRAVLTSGGNRVALRSAPRTTEQGTEQTPQSEFGENSSEFEPPAPESDPQTPEARNPPRSAPPPAVPVDEPAFMADARAEQEKIDELRARHVAAQGRKDTRALVRGEVEAVEEPRRAPGPKTRAADARMALLGKLEGAWLGGLRTANPGLSFASWGPTERGQVDHLVKQYGPEVTELLLRYVIAEWADLNKRMLKGSGGVPTLGFVVKLHASLSFEAQKWSAIGAIKSEVDAWYDAHPGEMMPTANPELYARYTAAVAKSEGRS